MMTYELFTRDILKLDKLSIMRSLGTVLKRTSSIGRQGVGLNGKIK
jgi:hypothetical protein